MHLSILVLALLLCNASHAQKITSNELLDKAIAFHDPNGQWSVFNSTFEVLMKTPKSTDRLSTINLNIPKEQFILKVEKDSVSYAYSFDKKKCATSLNGSTNITEENRKTYGLNCERGTIM